MVELKKIATEQRNPNTMNIDSLSTLDMVKLINQEDHHVAEAVALVTDKIAEAIDVIAERMGKGGRLIYCGAGTSGRLGIQDAAECPPTFGVENWVVQGIIAGGRERVFTAGENAEDFYENGANDVKDLLKAGDVLVGISAAGGAQYVVGALETAKKLGCTTVALTNNPGVAITKVADISIVCDTGAEAITGSTRLKAGNTQKFVLNMLSTGAMIKTGKVYENLMINLKPSNVKLKGRVVRITAAILDCSEEEATALLEKNDWNIRKTVEGVK